MRKPIIALLGLAIAGCGGTPEMVPLLSAAGVPLTDPTTVPLRVVTRSTAVKDPMHLQGSNVMYGDVEVALGHAVASATAPWAESHQKAAAGRDGWELFVEITNASASYDDDRVVFSLGVRATLRQRAGYEYLAQTQTSCRQGGIVQPDKGAPVMYGCMTEIGRNLAGWLEGVDLDAVAPPHST
jgi:hypothetical protein